MIIEDERSVGGIDFDESEANMPVSMLHDTRQELTEFIQNHHQIRDRGTHSQLQADLVEHLWQRHGHEDEDVGVFI